MRTVLTTPPAGTRSTRTPLVALGAVALAVVVLTGCLTADETTAFNLVNQDRAANGAPALGVNGTALTKAQGWARHLADRSGGVCSSATLIHSDLTQGAPAGWRRLGENVGCRTVTGSVSNAVAPLEAQFMGSSGHRANIVDPRFTHAGIGMTNSRTVR